MTSASGSSERRTCSASASSNRSPLVATITGSSTTCGGRCQASQRATTSMLSAPPSIPILTASTTMSSLIASSCSARNDAGGLNTARTPRVFCAVSEAITAMP